MRFRLADGTAPQHTLRCTCLCPAIQHRAFFLILLLTAGCLSAGQAPGQALQPDEQPSTVRGIVVNAVTHAPIARALVSSPDERYATLTDGEGNFEFTLPKANTDAATDFNFVGNGPPDQVRFFGNAGTPVWLIARKPGFLSDPNDGRQVEALPGGEVTISLMPEAVIKGRITTASDAAVGITVQLYSRQVQDGLLRWMPGISVRANSSGEFRFAELLPGSYRVVTHELMDNDPVATIPGSQLYGFPPVYFPGVANFSAATAIQLTAGQTFQADLSLTRQPYYPVRIPVANGEMNGGMNVSVQGHRGPGYSLGYNGGEQRIEGLLPNGNYLVEASSYGQNSVAGMMNLAVTGAQVEGPTMTLARSSSISLDVKEEFSDTTWRGSGSWSDGKHTFTYHGPRAYLQASVEPADDFEQQRGGASIRPPMKPNDDALVLENLSPGRYWLRLYASRGYVAAATMGGVDLLHEPLVVGAGGGTTPIEIKMRDDTAEIHGTVAGVVTAPTMTGEAAQSGLSTPEIWLYCVPLPDSPGQFQQLGVSPDGKFDYQMMTPGTYRVLAFKNQQPNLPYRDAEAMKAYETKGQVIHLAAGEKATVQLQIISSE